mmetsp:Transcript_73031/g.136416  ORF Transcript_73031/g.136416 Transcript_73031/m.136416 type:complete len:813 (-) Transcript_73031:99-2537(-)
MGCGGTKLADVKEKLDGVEKVTKENPTGEGNEGLDLMEKAAKDLVASFERLVKADVQDSSDLNRIQSLSELVNTNLESRINIELFKKKDGDAIADEILRIARILDAVRATKASDRIAEAIRDLKERIATNIINRVGTLLDEFSKAEVYKEKSKQILDLVENAHKKAPSSTKITEQLMEKIVKLSELVLKFTPAVIAGDVALITTVEEVGQRLDKVARELVAVLSASWDPPCAPKLEEAVVAQAAHAVFEHLDRVTAEVKTSAMKPDVVKSCLTKAKPWWQHAQKADGCRDRMAKTLTELELEVSSEFRQAVEGGNTTKTAALLQSAKEMDQILASYGDLPTTGREGSGDEGGLEASLLRVQSYYQALRLLKLIDKELSTSTLNLSSLLVPMNELAGLWDAVKDKDDIQTQFTSSMKSLVKGIEEEATRCEASADIPRLNQLEEFADRFDDIRLKLTPPSPEETGGPLVPTIGRSYCGLHLASAEAEVAKSEGSSPQKMLQALKDFHTRYLKASKDEGFEQRAKEITAAIVARVLDAYRSAKALAESEKLEQLRAFATKMDETLSSIGDGASSVFLAQQLKAYDDAFKQLTIADAELSKENGLNPGVLLKALQDLAASWPAVPKSRMLHERVRAISRTMNTRMEDSVDKASEAGDLQKLENLSKFIEDLEKCQEALGIDESSALRAKLRESLPCAHLSTAHSELAKESKMNPQIVLQQVKSVAPLWTDLQPDSAAHTMLNDLCGKVRSRVSASFTEAVEAKNVTKREALLKFATDFDSACSQLSGTRPAGVVEELNARVGNNNQPNSNRNNLV